MIRFENVSKTLGGMPILEDISFSVSAGETLAVMGPSGGGKTTLLRCINGLELIHHGTLTVAGTQLHPAPSGLDWQAFRVQIGVVFQQYNLFPHLTVMQNITLAPVLVKKQHQEEANAHALKLLESMQLAHRAKAYPHTLSGGEKQRVAIARALAMSPRIMLLDEPTSALDPVMTADVRATMANCARQGLTLVAVSHDAPFIQSVANRILFLHHGHIAALGTWQQIQESPHPAVRRYLDGL